MSTETLNLTPLVYAYLHRVSLREAPVLSALRQHTKKLSGAIMQISPEQGQFMALLVELIGAKKTLDISTFTGYSALVVALALPAGGQVISCDIDPEVTKIAREFWQKAKVENKIHLALGSAKQTLQQLIDEGGSDSFDFVFIDADKNNYDDYYEKALVLVRQGGLIAIDNVLWNGQVADLDNNDSTTRSLRQLNEKIHQDKRVTMSMIPIGDGLTLALKR